MFMADPPSSRHEDENPDISDEKLQANSCRFRIRVADGDVSTCRFAEFSPKWRTDFSHIRGESYNRTVVHKLLPE
jgi:hypothetical protein